MKHTSKTSKLLIGLMIFWLVLTLFYVVGCIYFCVSAISENNIAKVFLWIFLLLVFLVISFFICLGTNRLCCTIQYDVETKELSRKGLFGKFEHTVKTENIQDVILTYIYKIGTCIEIIEKENECYTKTSKKHPIRLELNKENVEFVKLFWSKPITQKMLYGKFKELSDYDKRQFGL